MSEHYPPEQPGPPPPLVTHHQPEYQVPQQHENVQYVQYQQPQPAAAVAPQQEHVVCQTLQTPQQQQQQQQPQYQIVLQPQQHQPQQQQQQHHVAMQPQPQPPPQQQVMPPPVMQAQPQQQVYQQQPTSTSGQQYATQMVVQQQPQHVQHVQMQYGQQPQYVHQQQPQQQQQQQQAKQCVMLQRSPQVQQQPGGTVRLRRPQQQYQRAYSPQQQQQQRQPQPGTRMIIIRNSNPLIIKRHPSSPNILYQRNPRPGMMVRTGSAPGQPQQPQQQQQQTIQMRPVRMIRHPGAAMPAQRQQIVMRQQPPQKVWNAQTQQYEMRPATLTPCQPPANVQYRPPVPVRGPSPAPQQQQPQPQQKTQEIAYNVEHVFTENGREVRKMPIKVGDQTYWVDCVDGQDASTQPPEDGIMLDLDMDNTKISSSTQQQPQNNMTGPPPPVQRSSSSGMKSAKDFDEAQRNFIVDQCVKELISPAELARQHNVNVTAIRSWIKGRGQKLPAKYKVTSSKPTTPKVGNDVNPAQANQSLLLANNAKAPVQFSQGETITVYAAPDGENSHSPPAQMVRQLVVTDNKVTTSQPAQSQLQLPQRPVPPNQLQQQKQLDKKPVAEPYKPKLIPGKVAVCKNCGTYSNDFNKCTRCKKPIPEDCKALPDPDYKPTESEKAAANANNKLDLRNVRIQHKPRKKAANEEPECIALSSDEEEEEEEEDNKDNKGDNAAEEAKESDAISASDNQTQDNKTAGGGAEKSEEASQESNNSETANKSDSVNAGGSAPTPGGASGDAPLKYGSKSASDGRIVALLTELQGLIKGQGHGQFTSLTCRSIRVGSYKSMNKEKVYFTPKAMYIKVPYILDQKRIITLTVPASDILKIHMHTGRSMPLLFVTVVPSTCARIREDLSMSIKSGLYLDLGSGDETMKRITMLPDRMSDEVKDLLKTFYHSSIEEMDAKAANDLLVKSSPKAAVNQQALLAAAASATPNKKGGNGEAQGAAKVEKYCQFPPTGSHSVSVTQEDYFCLEDESFLNDVIIDFYFKWIQETVIPPNSRDRTHIFTTFFYKRLTTRPPKQKNKLHPIEDNVNLSAAEKRYERVRRWTKKVNIFEKDFVIVPINEHSHWFVAVICYPGLVGCRRMDNDEPVPEGAAAVSSPVQEEQKAKKKGGKETTEKKKVMQIGSTSIIPLKPGTTTFMDKICLDEDDSDRDEADASDDDMVEEEEELLLAKAAKSDVGDKTPVKKMEEGDDKKEDEEAMDVANVDKKEEEKESATEATSAGPVAIKQPCILIFDSLQTGSRARVAATLREYLKCEYKTKMAEDREFNKDTIKGCCPKVPQQPNFSDCGIFALQYVESFFKSPLKDFSLPIKSLHNWFPTMVVKHKRSDIANIIRDLAAKQNKDKGINFPNLVFTPETGSGYSDDEDGNSRDGQSTPLKGNMVGKSPSIARVVTTTTASSVGSPRIIHLSANKMMTPSAGSLMIQKKKGRLEIVKMNSVVSTTNAQHNQKPTSGDMLPSPSKTIKVVVPRLTAGSLQVVQKEVRVPSTTSVVSSTSAAAAATSVTTTVADSCSEKEEEPKSEQHSPDSTSNNKDNNKEEEEEKSAAPLVNYSDSSSSGTTPSTPAGASPQAEEEKVKVQETVVNSSLAEEISEANNKRPHSEETDSSSNNSAEKKAKLDDDDK